MEEYNNAAWEELIDRVEQTRVDAIGVNYSCPHNMPERKMGAAVDQDCALHEEISGWVNVKATVPVCTGVMMHGYGLVKKLCTELQDFMKQHDFTSIEDFRGASLDYFTTHTDLVRRQKEATELRKAKKQGLQSDKDWTGDGFVKETESMVSN